ncbi:hypothetical protein OG943_15585 [Amycolatopsis sp. NBC_00345]|uniref:hypothetical protein n=1 Tax=Amycolatopsis sp. NBC_00345 TaxID=2975955 RepID=UPI002E2764F0
MGEIAHYVIVTEDGPDLRYSHWGATSLLRDMFWGPEHALRFATAQEPCDRWRSQVWCEGAACIDTVRRQLVLYTGYDNIPVRRTYLAMLAATWAGWSVRWAGHGLFDIIGHLGLDPDLVRDHVDADPLEPDWDRTADDSITTVLSVRGTSGSLTFHALGGGLLEDLVAAGPDEILAGAHPRARLTPTTFPMSGLHLDLARREAGYWTGDGLPDPRTPPHWPGWTFTCWFDRYEDQLARTDGKLAFPIPSQTESTAQILGFLAPRDPMDTAAMATQLSELAGPGAQISTSFHAHHPLEPDEELRSRMLATGLATLPQTPEPTGSAR